jgi:SPP1 family predicted phage head-tail adaptor
MPANPRIDAGSLRHRIQIQMSNPAAQDATGGQIATAWTAVRSTWASIEAVGGGKEQYQSEQFSAQVTHMIIMRYSAQPAIRPGMQVVFTEGNGTVHTYQIQAVVNVKLRNTVLNLLCNEVDGGQ